MLEKLPGAESPAVVRAGDYRMDMREREVHSDGQRRRFHGLIGPVIIVVIALLFTFAAIAVGVIR